VIRPGRLAGVWMHGGLRVAAVNGRIGGALATSPLGRGTWTSEQRVKGPTGFDSPAVQFESRLKGDVMDPVLDRDIERMHDYEQKQLKWKMPQALSKVVEKHYRARFVRVLEARGIGPVAVCGANDPVDLLIAGHAVELKVCRSRRKRDRCGEYYQALLHDVSNNHRLNGDLVVVLCVNREDELYPYIIPRRVLGARRTVEITSAPGRYGGQWAGYLDAFQHFNGGGK